MTNISIPFFRRISLFFVVDISFSWSREWSRDLRGFSGIIWSFFGTLGGVFLLNLGWKRPFLQLFLHFGISCGMGLLFRGFGFMFRSLRGVKPRVFWSLPWDLLTWHYDLSLFWGENRKFNGACRVLTWHHDLSQFSDIGWCDICNCEIFVTCSNVGWHGMCNCKSHVR